MAFVKTTWVDNALPALTATQLNRIEQGIADAHTMLSGGKLLVHGWWGIASSTLATNGEQTVGVTHNLAIPATSKQIVVGMLRDGSWSGQFQWRQDTFDGNSMNIRFMNHGPNSGSAIFDFAILEFTV